MIKITDAAALEIKDLVKNLTNDIGLRIFVHGGGCSGFSYEMNLNFKQEGDEEYEKLGIKVFVDPISLSYLSGSTLDFLDELGKRGFRMIDNPNAKSTCGCGTSFET